ncbi:hypothetical protein JQ590_31335, partial [Bradyrhizobium diazoefficiens]|nr:hypothetical protein [Bradyrhizobium diazoefficiens]
GNDTLDGGAGNDTLTGGVGADKYIYAGSSGADTITDFNRGEGDVIDVSGVTGVFSFADIQSKAVASGANTLITFSAGNTLTLTGVAVGSLQASDFIFAASINGTSGNDNGFDNGIDPVVPVVTGTSSAEAIYGLAGNDVIEGLGGNDYIDGGTGRDVADYHQATGGITVDMANGSVTGDVSVGSDLLRSIEGVRGTDFADTYVATGFGFASKNNSLDIEVQSSISNTFEGGGGDDKITSNALTQAAFDAGLRSTQASYAHALAAVTVDLGAGTATSTAGGDAAQIGTDTLINVTGVVGSDFNDTLIGRNDSVNDQFGFVDVFFGGKGDDLIDGKGGYDFVAYSSLGNPASITGGITVNMAAGTVTGDTSIGTDTLRSIESIRGTQFNDVYDATGFGSGSINAGSGGGFNSFEGMAGDDTITGNGSTRVDYNYAAASVTVDLAAGTGHSTVADDALVGNDTFIGADVFGMKHGINSVRGSSYDDFLFGSNNASGTEFFVNSRGDDTIDGRGGFDRAQYWSAASDTVTAGIAIDMAAGTVKGDASVGNDTLKAVEAIQGTRFADTYTAVGFSGASTNAGSFGTFNEFQGMGGNDTVTGNGNTRIAFYNALDGVTVDLVAGTAKGTAAGDKADVGTDTLKGGINAVTGSDFADTLLGSANGSNAEIFEGRAGNDAINGRGGYDMAIYNNDGSVTTGIAVTATATTMTVTGDARVGTDTLTAVESVRGTNLADTYNATGFNGASIDFGPTSTFNEFEGMAGNDTITGNGNTRISYVSSTGGVTVDLVAGTAVGNGSVGTDTIVSGVNAVRGSNSADTITGNSLANILEGMSGNDTLDGGAGNDTLTGGVGADKYIYAGSSGADTITDFNRGEGDVIDVSGVTGVFSFADIQSKAVASGANTLITFSAGNTLTLTGVAVGSLQASDFIFAASINGTSGNDNGFDNGIDPVVPVVTGTSSAEAIYGLAGNDVIEGLGGNDYIDGGTGRDVADYHQATGGITVDMANGSVTGDVSVGSDLLRSIEGVRGTDFADTYVATGFGFASKNNSLDIEVQSSISNTFEGGGGDDKITSNALTQAAFDAGLRSTQASYAHALAAVTVDLGAGTATSTAGGDAAQIGTDTLINVTGVVGSDFNDTLIGRNDSVNDQFGFVDVFFGGKGDDLIDGKGGYDFVAYSSLGNPASITGGITVNMAAGTVTGDTSIGTDTLRSIESIRGTQFNDVYDATGFGSGSINAGSGGGFNSFEGMAGDDTITGNGSTRVDYNYAAASVTVDLAAGTGHSTVADDALVGNDTFIGADVFGMKHGINSVRGSSYDDFLFGSNNASGTEFFVNSRGDDTIDGRGGFDRAQYWSAASDTVTAGIAIDMAAGTVKGDASVGNDTLKAVEAIQGTRFADTYTAVGFSGASTNAGSFGTFNEFQGMGGNDTVTGNGNTRIAFYNALDGVTVDLVAGTAKGTAAGDKADVGTDTLKGGINAVTGSDFADTLLGSANGSGTTETFEGRAGNDAINGRDGYDMAIYNNDGSVTTGIAVTATATTMTVTGDARVGTDTLTAVESVRGTNLADTYNATGFNGASPGFGRGSIYNEFEGMAGNDTITGNGNTRISYVSSTGGVTVDLIAGTAIGNGSVGTDTINGGVDSVRGSNFDDVISGTNNAIITDVYFGGGGNDKINGRGGYDYVNYSDGSITGGINVNLAAGTVVGDGSVGNDTLTGVELIRGTHFADTYVATGFNGSSTNAGSYGTFNTFEGMSGNDSVTGNGDTRVEYTQALAAVTVDLAAGTGQGTVAGDIAGVGFDSFTGGVNAIRGSAFNDTLFGSNNVTGAEEYIGGAGNDFIDGRGGFDRAMYSTSSNDVTTAGIVVDLAAGTVSGNASVGNDTLKSIESIRGTDFGDTFKATGFSGSSTNAGSNGTFNEFEGEAGNDSITGNGNTRISFYHANDGVDVNLSTGISSGIASGDIAKVGTDTFNGVSAVRGSEFGDHIVGKSGSVTLDGREGDDVIVANGGANTLIGGAGNDHFVFNANLTSGATISDFAGNGAAVGDSIEFNGFGTAAQGATFTFVGTVNGGLDSTWQIHSGLDSHNEFITLVGINSAAGVHSTDYLLQ